MMQLFRKSNGVVTVLVVMIMIPTIFLASFLGDLSRLKLAGNQAIMAADTYGEVLLEQYDNILKELYGLFAVTQMDGAAKKLDELDKLVKASFDPNNNTVSAKYQINFLKNTNISLLNETKYEGFMPFSNSGAELKREFVEESSLRNNNILVTQVGDFMKYRVFQQLIDSDVTEAINAAQNSKKDGEVVEQKQKLDEKVDKFIKLTQEFYDLLKEIWMVPEYAEEVYSYYALYKGDKTARDNKDIIGKITKEKKEKLPDDFGEGLYYAFYKAYYKCYFDYVNNLYPAITAFDKKEKDGKELSEDEGKLYNIFLRYFWMRYNEMESNNFSDSELIEKLKELTDVDLNPKYDYYFSMFYPTFVDALQTSINGECDDFTITVTFSNYGKKADALTQKAKSIVSSKGDIEKERDKLKKKLNAEGVTEELKENITKELELYEKLFDNIDNYQKIAKVFDEKKSFCSDSNTKTGKMMSSVKKATSSFLKCEHYSVYQTKKKNNKPAFPDDLAVKTYRASRDREVLSADDYDKYINWADNIDGNQILDFYTKRAQYNDFYNYLTDTFTGSGENSKKKEAEGKKKESEGKTGNCQTQLDKEEGEYVEKLNLRDCPVGFIQGQGEKYEFHFSDLKKLISFSGLAEVGNEILLKFYAVEYGFGMFSSRVTNAKLENAVQNNNDEEENQPKESLTGFEMSRKINYLYRSEMEYLLAGNSKSQDNLNSARNRILAFRGVMNFASTYTIQEINEAIESIGAAFAGFPILYIAVVGLARVAVAAIETKADWDRLKAGEKVLVMKKELGDLTGAQTLKGWLSGLSGKEEKTSDGVKLDYEQYLLIMILFFTSKDKVYARIGDLIELNTNAVLANIGEDGELTAGGGGNMKFSLSKAYTAVNVTCSIQMDFMVIPKDFAQKTVGADVADELSQFQKNRYNFTITRGY